MSTEHTFAENQRCLRFLWWIPLAGDCSSPLPGRELPRLAFIPSPVLQGLGPWNTQESLTAHKALQVKQEASAIPCLQRAPYCSLDISEFTIQVGECLITPHPSPSFGELPSACSLLFLRQEICVVGTPSQRNETPCRCLDLSTYSTRFLWSTQGGVIAVLPSAPIPWES